ncbi:hypothetical protein L9F63_012947 [Diploptera punctata]|uniref:Uncharacterized protein n=1 Tax=Diploptera punctata TaxID=6984 RepID=A0AAD8AB73_DIPPU|nr:hypothetical protein L9F63_025965 [Diploptera punctata]KAJ9595866.1 hypothetical protein L9F63_012947 [Diploptera punctata]
MSEIIWLAFFRHDTLMEEFFEDINIPFDCEFFMAQRNNNYIVLTEVYRVSSTSSLHTHHFGNWNLHDGFSHTNDTFYQRRSNLHGFVIKTGTIHDNPIQIKREINDKPVEIGGYFGEVWKILEKTLNFRSDYYKPSDYSYGSRLPNGTWNGLMSMLLKDEIEISAADFYWTAARAEVVDFIAPIIWMTMHIKKSHSIELEWNNFLMPFNWNLWLTLLITVFCAALFLFVTMKMVFQWQNKQIPLTDFNAAEAILYVCGVVCMQGQKWIPSYISGRIMVLVIYLMGVVLYMSYSASLISSIMTRKYVLPFTDFHTFLKDGSYTLGALKGSAELDFFKVSS